MVPALVPLCSGISRGFLWAAGFLPLTHKMLANITPPPSPHTLGLHPPLAAPPQEGRLDFLCLSYSKLTFHGV